jgi:hypothetical protein
MASLLTVVRSFLRWLLPHSTKPCFNLFDQLHGKVEKQSCINWGSVVEKLVISFVLLALLAISTIYFLIVLLNVAGFLV